MSKIVMVRVSHEQYYWMEESEALALEKDINSHGGVAECFGEAAGREAKANIVKCDPRMVSVHQELMEQKVMEITTDLIPEGSKIKYWKV